MGLSLGVLVSGRPRSIEGVDKFRKDAVGGLSSVSDAVEDKIPLHILLELPSVDNADVVDALVPVLDRRLDPHVVGDEVVKNDPIQPGGSAVTIGKSFESGGQFVTDGETFDRLPWFPEVDFMVVSGLKLACRIPKIHRSP